MLPSLWKENGGKFPLFDFGTDFDRLFTDFLGERRLPARWGWEEKGFTPPMDVRETDEAFVVETELPGMKLEEIEVKIDEGVLTILAERKLEKDEKLKGYHRSERYFGRMERQVALPATIEADKVEAAYKDGVLRVTVPKLAGAKSKTVAVKVN